MKTLAAAAALLLAASPVFAQATAPAGTTRGAEGTTTDAGPAPDGQQGEGRQSATEGSKMVKTGPAGAAPPAAAGAPAKP